MPKSSSEFFRALESFSVPVEGEINPRVVTEGQVVAASDVLVKTHRHLFEPLQTGSTLERVTAPPALVSKE